MGAKKKVDKIENFWYISSANLKNLKLFKARRVSVLFRFAHPLFFLCFLILPFLVWYYFRVILRKSSAIKFSETKIFSLVKPGWDLKCRHLPFWFRILALALFFLALSRPQTSHKTEEIFTHGVDIILTLDISSSMKAEDFKPQNRLEAAKEVIKDFVQQRKYDRIGLVIFAAHGFTQCPLTLDKEVLLQFLDLVHIGLIEDGTAIGTGLAVSINRLRESQAKSKVIILLTDGVNNRGEIDPLTAAELAHTYDIKIYTIGAGKPGYVPYSYDDPFWGKRKVKMKTQIDENLLRQIAQKTGGMYFRAKDTAGLAQIYKKIDQLEKTEIKIKEFLSYEEEGGRYILWGLVFLGLEIILGATRFRKIP
jgi:Ca-activated chloride channel family protein